MDLSAKALVQMILVIMGVFLLFGIVSYSFVSARSRDAAYAIVEYLEINGYDAEAQNIIDDYSDSSNLTVRVTPVNSGVYANGNKNRYRVDVTFSHFFSVINLVKDTTYTLYTRAVEY